MAYLLVVGRIVGAAAAEVVDTVDSVVAIDTVGLRLAAHRDLSGCLCEGRCGGVGGSGLAAGRVCVRITGLNSVKSVLAIDV